jgi:uncharacterized damage-inducible protein DinB
MFTALEPLDGAEFIRHRDSSFTSIRDTVAHMYLAESTWYSRWQGHSPGAMASPEEFHTVAALATAWQALENQIRQFVQSLTEDGGQRRIEYRTLSGTPSVSRIDHMIQHVVNHATYHRGQVVTLLRQAGGRPLNTDLIAYARERDGTSASQT